jgi:hypothetical protein
VVARRRRKVLDESNTAGDVLQAGQMTRMRGSHAYVLQVGAEAALEPEMSGRERGRRRWWWPRSGGTCHMTITSQGTFC